MVVLGNILHSFLRYENSIYSHIIETDEILNVLLAVREQGGQSSAFVEEKESYQDSKKRLQTNRACFICLLEETKRGMRIDGA